MKLMLKTLAALCCASLCLTACTSAPPTAASAAPFASEIVFEDSLGNTIALPRQPQRVAALNGSYAEIWLLSGGTLAGVTQDAYTERALALPEDTALLGTVHTPDLEQLLALAPDLVLLSADVENQLQMDAALTSAGIPHGYFRVDTFSDYLALLQQCTTANGRSDLYEANGVAIAAQVDAAIALAADKPAPRVLYLRAFSTGVKAKGSDSIAGAMLQDLGAVNLAEENDSLLEELQLESILAADPDYIFVTTMGSEPEKALAQLESTLLSNPAWASLTAVHKGRYRVLPKELFHYKPNARWGESYELLAKILYSPEASAAA